MEKVEVDYSQSESVGGYRRGKIIVNIIFIRQTIVMNTFSKTKSCTSFLENQHLG